MSLEDLFGSDLEDSEDEERGKPNAEASRKAQLDELFGDSPSEEEAEEREQSEERSTRDIDSASGQESDRSDEHEKQEENDEEDVKEELHEPSHHQHSLTADLFGDDEDLSSEEEQEKVSPKADYEERNQQDEPQEAGDFAERREILAEGEDREGEGEEEEEETVIDVTIPYCKVSLGSEVFFVKMPNFLSVETKPFDAALYEDEVEDDEVLDEEGNARLKLKVENTIRWRSCKDQDGNDVKESNARVVRWSDGTKSLLLGGEVFDIHKTKIDGDFNHLFVQQGTGLQAQTVFKEKLTFRPHSTASQTHRKMTLSIADRASKAQKIRILPAAGKDPEAQRHEMIKKEEERLRTQLRRESQQRRIRERGHNKGLSASYLEPDRYGEEDDDFQSLLALKKKYKKDLAQGFQHGDLSDDDSLGGGIDGLESDEEEENTNRLLAAKEDKESDNEPDNTRRKRTSSEGGSTKKRKKVIVESDDDEESD